MGELHYRGTSLPTGELSMMLVFVMSRITSKALTRLLVDLPSLLSVRHQRPCG